jgi:hypothetical protein
MIRSNERLIRSRGYPVVWISIPRHVEVLHLGQYYLSAWAGVRRACKGWRHDPSPTEAKDLCFWFLIERMKPLTTTISLGSKGSCSRRRAMEGAVRGFAPVAQLWTKLLLLQLPKTFVMHCDKRGRAIVVVPMRKCAERQGQWRSGG